MIDLGGKRCEHGSPIGRCPACDLRATRTLEAERDGALAVLKPSMPESGLVDACRQRMQAYISARGNAEKAEAEAARLAAAIRTFFDRPIRYRHGGTTSFGPVEHEPPLSPAEQAWNERLAILRDAVAGGTVALDALRAKDRETIRALVSALREVRLAVVYMGGDWRAVDARIDAALALAAVSVGEAGAGEKSEVGGTEVPK